MGPSSNLCLHFYIQQEHAISKNQGFSVVAKDPPKHGERVTEPK